MTIEAERPAFARRDDRWALGKVMTDLEDFPAALSYLRRGETKPAMKTLRDLAVCHKHAAECLTATAEAFGRLEEYAPRGLEKAARKYAAHQHEAAELCNSLAFRIGLMITNEDGLGGE